jgi:hypothetical protein
VKFEPRPHDLSGVEGVVEQRGQPDVDLGLVKVKIKLNIMVLEAEPDPAKVNGPGPNRPGRVIAYLESLGVMVNSLGDNVRSKQTVTHDSIECKKAQNEAH